MTRSLMLLGALWLCACAGTTMSAVPKLPTLPERTPSVLHVGTGRAELTMPPGASTFGHALDSRVADGYWTRTYCRVFLFESARGATAQSERVAIIPCELSAISSLLQRKVAERVAALLHPSQIMLTAVHTHAAVGHYFGEGQYVGPVSTRRPGFDEALLEALADSIAHAIEAAHESLRPARLSWRHERDFYCFARNRSLDAYEQNGEAEPPLPSPLPPSAQHCDLSGRKDFRAIDPAIDVLRIDQVDPNHPGRTLGPIGSISLFAMHPTVLSSDNRLFGGDTTGMVNRHVERELRREWAGANPGLARCFDEPKPAGCERQPDPLHGVINTNEGDISPIWSRGDIDEAISFGQRLAEFVWKHHPAPGSGSPESVLDLRYLEDDVRGAKLHDRYGVQHETCTYPELGQGAAGGASDHPTTVAALPLFETDAPRRGRAEGCQGVKRPLLGPVSCLTRSDGAFPAILPLSVVQLDDTLLGFIPTEATVTAGRRITTRMMEVAARHASPATRPKRAVIAGLANSYIQYLATRGEYELQAYEGASTLYGPNENAYFADRMALLTRSLFAPRAERDPAQLGEARRLEFPVRGGRFDRLAEPTGDCVSRKHLRTCTLADGADAPRICMYFVDGGPGDVALRKGPWLRLVQDAQGAPPVRMCRSTGNLADGCDPRGYVDDRGHEFRTRVHDEVDGGYLWSTLFSPDAALWQELGDTRVRLEVGGPAKLHGSAFSRSALPCTCTPREAALCLDGEVVEPLDDLAPPKPRAECGD